MVVNDLDADALAATAREIGATAVPGDCAGPDGVQALIEEATATLGRIDLYLANAGIDGAPGLDSPDSLQTSDEAWARILDVNVMAHVRAARLLVPGWLETGGGRFVVTASAAGLLTMIGSAPYSVTKHAAVAFAEWLSITYGHRGVTVQAICPQGVRTRMLEQSGPLQDLLSHDQALEPAEVAETWVASLADDRFLVLPHPEVARLLRDPGRRDRPLAGRDAPAAGQARRAPGRRTVVSEELPGLDLVALRTWYDAQRPRRGRRARSPRTCSPAAAPTSPTRSPTAPRAGCCADRRWATCWPPPTTWPASSP